MNNSDIYNTTILMVMRFDYYVVPFKILIILNRFFIFLKETINQFVFLQTESCKSIVV